MLGRGEAEAKILSNLQGLTSNNDIINQIMDNVKLMPSDNHRIGVLLFLTELTALGSRREMPFATCRFFAEFFCTISNAGFFGVAYRFKDYATLAAGIFSALSHAIYSQRLHDLDILGVIAVVVKIAINYKLVLANPRLAYLGAAAITINLIDALVTRRYLETVGPTIHVIWHLSAAGALYEFNRVKANTTPDQWKKINNISLIDYVPTMFKPACEKINNDMYRLATKSRCILF